MWFLNYLLDFLCSFDAMKQIMTSPLVSGGYLLSPLTENLMRLTEKEKPCVKDSKPQNVHKGIQKSPPLLAKEPMPVTDAKVFKEKKMKFVDRSRQGMEARNANRKNAGNDMNSLLEKGIDVESSVDGEHFQKPLKSSLPSCSKGNVEKVERQINGDTERGSGMASAVSRELNKGVLNDRALSSDFKGETPENGWDELVPLKGHPNAKTHPVSTAKKDKSASSHNDVLFDTVKDDEGKGDKRSNVFKADSDEFKGTTERIGGSAEPPRQKVSQKAMSYEKDKSKMPKDKESKKKLKSNQSNGIHRLEFPKGSIEVASLATSKDKQESSKNRDPFSDNWNTVTKPHDSSMTYGRELGDITVEEDDNLKDSKLVVKSEAHVFAEKSKEKSCGRKIEDLTTSKQDVKAPAVPPLTGNGLTSDAVAAPVDPVVIEENWVCCDRCQKWRLLPFGLNPDNLPKKWLCSMLYWL